MVVVDLLRALARNCAFVFALLGLLAAPDANAALGDCSQPVTDGPSPTATDCLFVLRASVVLETCTPECICDVDGSTSVSATDALACLRVATGVSGATLECPCPSTTTTTLPTTTTSTSVTSTTLSTTTTSLPSTTTTLPSSTTSTSTTTSTTSTTLASFKRVFVTSTLHDGALGGLSGADAICQTRADTAALGGTWTAWLSDSVTNAETRITDSEYRLIDDTTVVASSLADLTDGTLTSAIFMDELGGSPPGCVNPVECVWTATADVGFSLCNFDPASCCDDWTCNSFGGIACNDFPGFPATAGLHDATEGWSDDGPESCSSELHLYCFED